MTKGFVSFEQEIREIIDHIVRDSVLHGLWLNTLSYLENCGARKIASCQHPTAVKEEMLKHASEEFRHAFHLKKQLSRISQSYEDYRRDYLLGEWKAYHYLNMLDFHTSRYLRSIQKPHAEIKQLAYLLVTYAIELRAGELYPLYQASLKSHGSKVQVQSILLEEKEHLQEMESELSNIKEASRHIEYVCHFEAILFEKWINACRHELYSMHYLLYEPAFS